MAGVESFMQQVCIKRLVYSKKKDTRNRNATALLEAD